MPFLRRLTLGAFALSTFAVGFSSCTSPGDEVPPQKLVILHTNDHHGHPLPFEYLRTKDVGGLPARYTLVKEIRKNNENVLVLDGGDWNTGNPESSFFQAEADVLGYNTIGYDAVALGNHEFDNPLNVLNKQATWVKYPLLSANVTSTDGSPLPGVRPYIIKNIKGIRVAIFGLTTSELKQLGNPDIIRGVKIRDEIEVAKELVPRLHELADVVIAVTHMGIYLDNTEGSRRLAAQVPGIDLIVDGHTHTRLEKPFFEEELSTKKRVPIVQAWEWGKIVGRVDLTISKKGASFEGFEAIPINLKEVQKNADGTTTEYFVGKPIAQDPDLTAKLKPYLTKVDAMLSEKIGEAMATYDNANVRKRETELGNFMGDALAWYSSKFGAPVDFAISNSGSLRTPVSQGPITMKTLYGLSPFDNTFVIVQLKGSKIQELADYMATKEAGDGGFPVVSSNLRLTLDRRTKKASGITINGKPLDLNKTYRIGTHSYMATGGDGYVVFKNLKPSEKFDTSAALRDVLVEYIRNQGGRMAPQLDGRIHLVE